MKSILQKDLWSITSFLENKEYNFNKENTECELLFDLDEIDPIKIMKTLKKDRKYKII